MTVAELRQALEQFRGDLRIVVRGYESGYDDAVEAKHLMVQWDAKPTRADRAGDIFGRHDDPHFDEEGEPVVYIRSGIDAG